MQTRTPIDFMGGGYLATMFRGMGPVLARQVIDHDTHRMRRLATLMRGGMSLGAACEIASREPPLPNSRTPKLDAARARLDRHKRNA